MAEVQEDKERRILEVLQKGFALIESDPGESWTQLRVANQWINELPHDSQWSIHSSIHSGEHGVFWAQFLSHELHKFEKHFNNLVEEGEPFEHEGVTYQVVDVITFKTFVDAYRTVVENVS